jgi:hypothetical protein
VTQQKKTGRAKMLVLFFYVAIRPIRSATRSELFHGRRKADGDFF